MIPAGETITCPVYAPARVRESLADGAFGTFAPWVAQWERFLDSFNWVGGPWGWGAGTLASRSRITPGQPDGWAWTEPALEQVREAARLLYQENDFAGALLNRLVEYTGGKGLPWKACRRLAVEQAPDGGDNAPADVARLQLAFDLYADHTRLRTRQREKALRYWRDGEAIRRLFRGRSGRLPAVRWVEPEAVKAPPQYVGDPRCTFGVLCPAADEQNHVGLWVCDPRNPADGEAVRLAGADPGEFRGLCEELGLPVGAGVCVALKHGTDAAVKRGLPLLFSSEAMLRAARALLKNVLETAKEQARIAWLARHVGATQEAVTDFLGSLAGQSGVLVPQVRGGSLVPTPATAYGPGPREIRTNEHTIYSPGPVTPGTPNFLAAEQAALRSAAARVGMPEYMISASAEQANYASTKEAGSPFVTAREADLAVFAEDDRAEAREVLRLACESGAVPGRADDLDCEVSPPPVAIRSELEAEQVASLRMRDRVLSPQQRIRHAGGDPKHVIADWRAWPLEMTNSQ